MNLVGKKRELKPPLTFEQQLDKFKERNLIVEDESHAIEVLQRINYYRLNGYTLHLKKDDMFLSGTTFEQIARLYDFDTQLRSMLIPMLERIEIAFRTHIAYLLATKYNDPLCYLDKTNFKSEKYHQLFLEDVNREISRSKEKFIEHHKKHYDDQFPLWVVVEVLSFGTLSKLFANMKKEDQDEIAKEHYSISGWYVASWLESLTYVRNLCAHYARLYNKTLTKSPALFKKDKDKIYNRKIFATILIVKRLTKDAVAWRTFLASLVALMETYDDMIDLDLLGFPTDWYDLLNV